MNKNKNFLPQIIIVIFLLILIIIGVLPGVVKGGKWAWLDIGEIDNQKAFLTIRDKGLNLPQWQEKQGGKIEVGDKKWFFQKLNKGEQKIFLLTLSQEYYRDHPTVEWTDLSKSNIEVYFCTQQLQDVMKTTPQKLGINSSFANIKEALSKNTLTKNDLEKILNQLPDFCESNFSIISHDNKMFLTRTQDFKDWKTDSFKTLKVNLDDGKTIKTLFFRGRNRRETFAVLQWYAWESGGNFAPKKWFFADLKAQLKKQRLGWVAVSLRIPIEVLGDIDTVKPLAESLVIDIQKAIKNQIRPN